MKVEYEAEQLLFEDPEDYHEYGDAIFSPTFKRGYDGYLQERKLARLAQAAGGGPSIYGDGSTDWDQDAVVNEDDLFGDNVNSREIPYKEDDDDFLGFDSDGELDLRKTRGSLKKK